MKLYFLRHGLADRGEWYGSDIERPLTDRGKARMERTANTIDELDLGLDVILTSPLTRAFQTAQIVAHRLDMPDRLVVEERLCPGFCMQDLGEIVRSHAGMEAMMLVGHEPDFSETIADLIGGGQIECKKGSLAKVVLYEAGPLAGELAWLIPPKVLVA